MQIINAKWEKRNIGSDAYEIRLEPNDNFNDSMMEISRCAGDYIVVKIPVVMTEAISKIVGYGYTFIETAVSCHYDVSKPFNISDAKKKRLNISKYEEMKENDVLYLYESLRMGLYTTDRIARDTFYSVKVANERYRGWIADEIKNGSYIYKVIYDNNPIGFFGLKRTNEREFYGFLNGVYRNYQSRGLGTVMHCLQVQAAQHLGADRVLSAFSTNNVGAFNIHMELGYKLNNVEYVFIKHKE